MDDLSIYRSSNLLYNQEKMSRYKPGGFHPVCLGDTFKEGRYKIRHKLGWGGCSTVWLAWDGVSEMWVSIKVKSADSSADNRELEALRVLRETTAIHHFVRRFDGFLHHGPNGCHQCIVFELLGPSVENISGSNLGFTCPRLAHLPESELFDILGTPETEVLARVDGQPLQPDEDDEDIRLIDFGEAFTQGSRPDRLAQPPDIRAPETIFTDHFDYRLDLWRAGITIYSIIFGSRPFQHWGGTDKVVHQMINFVEELPAEWQPQWELMQLEDEKAKKRADPALERLLPVIRGLARFKPSDRISAAEALDMITQGEDQDWKGKADSEV
ncbi:kinase-like domain-containing protein [Leptodontidium sp. MPI-SDFR-AT-0119]|nr:kinase-like domain-containing protein [Leptodontidium sp. MPI-SDFR-AT-0119]